MGTGGLWDGSLPAGFMSTEQNPGRGSGAQKLKPFAHLDIIFCCKVIRNFGNF